MWLSVINKQLGGITMEKMDKMMTSELIFRAMKVSKDASEKREFFEEYERRLKSLQMTDEQIRRFMESDQIIIYAGGCYIKPDELLVRQPLIKSNNLLVMKNCTFSELVYLGNEASSIYINGGSDLNDEERILVRQNSDYFGISKSAREIHKRMQNLGLNDSQEKAFICNETKMIDRVKKHHFWKAAW